MFTNPIFLAVVALTVLVVPYMLVHLVTEMRVQHNFGNENFDMLSMLYKEKDGKAKLRWWMPRKRFCQRGEKHAAYRHTTKPMCDAILETFYAGILEHGDRYTHLTRHVGRGLLKRDDIDTERATNVMVEVLHHSTMETVPYLPTFVDDVLTNKSFTMEQRSRVVATLLDGSGDVRVHQTFGAINSVGSRRLTPDVAKDALAFLVANDELTQEEDTTSCIQWLHRQADSLDTETIWTFFRDVKWEGMLQGHGGPIGMSTWMDALHVVHHSHGDFPEDISALVAQDIHGLAVLAQLQRLPDDQYHIEDKLDQGTYTSDVYTRLFQQSVYLPEDQWAEFLFGNYNLEVTHKALNNPNLPDHFRTLLEVTT